MKRTAFVLAVVLVLAVAPALSAHPVAYTQIVAPGTGGDLTYIASYWGLPYPNVFVVTLEEQQPYGEGVYSRYWEFGSNGVNYAEFVRLGTQFLDVTPKRPIPLEGEAVEKLALYQQIVCWYRPWEPFTSCPSSAP